MMARVLERLEELYAIGDRIGFSAEEDRAHELAAGWMREAGLEVSTDEAGNLLGRVPGGGREVWTGSHLDTVPAGGRFDGALGVVAGLEAVARVGRPGLAVAAFRDEERGCAGSRALARFPEVFVELHIEQGPVLLRAGAPLGVVTGIVGYARAEVVFDGAAGHAGTTPMDARDDALGKAAEYVLRVRDTPRGAEVATVGRIEVEPGAPNVIPGRALVTVDVRSPEGVGRLVEELGLQPRTVVDPVSMSDQVRDALRDEVQRHGLPVHELHSGAGHDAGILAAAGVEAGMLFVRSLNGGVSHSPDELSSEEDIALAVDVLAATLRRLGEDDQVGPRLERGG
jgi:acetylornithine deacetylase/succinyl-diaminopimelate desuccinylase-like protein